MAHLIRPRWTRLLPVTLLAALLVVVPFSAAGAAPADQPVAAAAAGDWIARELDADEPSFDQFGKTAARTDVLFALAATASNEGAARLALAELRAGAAEYIGPPGSIDPGATAKVLLAVLVNREDPATFLEGRDLEAELRASMAADGSFAGDVFNQSLAMMALGATPGGVPAEATAWLAERQCDAGDFTFTGTCPGNPDVPDTDSTAIAIQALLAADATGPAAIAADFLVGAQNEDGSWPALFGEPNANTAGVAGQALRAAGEVEAADLAAEFVMSLQTEDGGIRFTAADTEPNGFATLQGVLTLGAPPYFELVIQPFADVAWTDLFGEEVDWLGDSGITRGCNPPANDRFCPDDEVTRGQMAAFLVRALDLPPGDNQFTDDDNSVFEADISALANAGITRGCNPPANDRFCPDDEVTRGQMAAFLFRALAG